MFTPQDIKRLKMERKRNSVPSAPGNPFQQRKRGSTSYSTKKTPMSKRNLTFASHNYGLVLQTTPLTNRKISSINTLTNDPSKTKQSTQDRSSIQTLRTERNSSHARGHTQVSDELLNL